MMFIRWVRLVLVLRRTTPHTPRIHPALPARPNGCLCACAFNKRRKQAAGFVPSAPTASDRNPSGSVTHRAHILSVWLRSRPYMTRLLFVPFPPSTAVLLRCEGRARPCYGAGAWKASRAWICMLDDWPRVAAESVAGSRTACLPPGKMAACIPHIRAHPAVLSPCPTSRHHPHHLQPPRQVSYCLAFAACRLFHLFHTRFHASSCL